MMYSRLGALLLAMIVLGAPVSLTVCEVMCAARTDAGTARHSCHQTRPTGTHDALSSHGHICGHGDELPVASRGTGDDQPMPAPAVIVVASLSIGATGMAPFAQLTAKSPPSHRHALVPLRL